MPTLISQKKLQDINKLIGCLNYGRTDCDCRNKRKYIKNKKINDGRYLSDNYINTEYRICQKYDYMVVSRWKPYGRYEYYSFEPIPEDDVPF